MVSQLQVTTKVANLLILYVYTDDLDISVDLETMLSLLSLSVQFGVTCLAKRIIVYLEKIISVTTSSKISEYIESHKSEDRECYEINRKRFVQNHGISVHLKMYLLGKCSLVSYDALTSSNEDSLVYSDDVVSSFKPDLKILYESKYMTDFTIVTDNESTQAHTFILRKGSQFFDSYFKFSSATEIHLDSIPLEHLELLLKYMYLGSDSIREMPIESVSDLIPHIDFLQLTSPFLKDYIGSLLSTNLTIEESLGYLSWSVKIGSKVMKDKALEYISEHYQEVTESQEFLYLEDSVKAIIHSLNRY